MLHAELHRKVREDAPHHERLEDILTSTVFGTLLVGGADDLLVQWLGRSRGMRGGRAAHLRDLLPTSGPTVLDYWFWPHIGRVEPDLMLRIGDLTVVIEAKYHSGQSGGRLDEREDDGDEDEADDEVEDLGPAEIVDETGRPVHQLVAQWEMCEQAYAGRVSSRPPEVSRALGRRVHVYLVKGTMRAKANRELKEEVREVLGARRSDDRRKWEDAFYVLTWEDLDATIQRAVEARAPVARRRWVDELARVLARRGLDTFAGIPVDWARGRGAAPAFSVFLAEALESAADELCVPRTMLGVSTDLLAPLARLGLASDAGVSDGDVDNGERPVDLASALGPAAVAQALTAVHDYLNRCSLSPN